MARARRDAPAARGRGLASQVSRQLVDWSRARGCRTVALDASVAGRPVYERLGFEQVGSTAELLRPAGSPASVGALAESASRSDMAELVTFDCEAFGGDRRSLLRALAGDASGRWFVTRQPDGTLDGTRTQRVLVPDESAFLDTLLGLGFVEQRRLAHMRLGELALSASRSRLVAQLSYATG